ncbi:MAG: penicillin-binding protein [Acidobacteria bacterium]|nr:penicillin-binding protein [Acidobacteriota bacterium]
MPNRQNRRSWLARFRPLGTRPGRSGNARPERSARDERLRDWRPLMRRRLLVGIAVFGLWAVGIEARLVHMQVMQHEALVARAERQQNRSITLHPKRGEILDREGRVLAYSVDADTIYAVPTDVDDPAATTAAVCGALGECTPAWRQTVEKRLGQQRAFAYVRRQVSPDAARRVAALQLDGIGFMKENRRYYPNKTLAAHLLGYVGIDNQGLSGIEAAYDGEIAGRPGKTLIQTDARQRAFSRIERAPTSGATVELTIDKYLQYLAERELRAAVREHDAEGGAVVMLDPFTGDVLALASEPSFNPNDFAASTPTARRNRAVQDVYEPGSTFKLVTTAAALEGGISHRAELFDVSRGSIRVGNSTIPDMHTYGVLSLEDVIVKSSNVGAIQLGLRVGPDLLIDFTRRFGFGRALSPDLRGESAGIVHDPAALNDRAVASVSMGYQVAVTPLQMAAAVSAVANGGELVEPRVVRAVVRGGVREERPRRVLGRAIEPATVAELTAIMEQVVERGTARSAKIPGYAVAGKTGTAEKLIEGRYSDDDHNASFIGFVPSRAPVLAALVMIDTPRGERFTGGAVAAPVFQRIAAAALRHLAVPPTVNPHPPVLIEPRLEPRVASTPVQHRVPDAAARVTAPAAAAASVLPCCSMPDVRGLSARQALEVLGRINLVARLDGVGFVVSHNPAPGAAIGRGTTAVLRLERRPASAGEGAR